MEEKHVMKWLLSYLLYIISDLSYVYKLISCMKCSFLHFFISFIHAFNVDAERMIVRMREMSINICKYI